MKRYYLVTTEHLEDALWFRDTEDFAVGMNMVAVQSSLSTAIVLVFILMSNHVHFVLYGSRREAEEFTRRFKGRYSQYYRRKWGVKEFLRRNRVEIKELPDEAEAVERALSYVLMNCVAAGICTHPGLYPWGCGSALFKVSGSEVKMDRNPGKGRDFPVKLGDLSGRARARLLHSAAADLPAEWVLSGSGYILPESFIDTDAVERLFRSPQRMDYFLRTSSKARKRMETQEVSRPSFKDQVILGAVPDLCQSLFQKNSFAELVETQKTELLRQLRYRFSACPNQLSRVCGLSYAETAKLLDAV